MTSISGKYIIAVAIITTVSGCASVDVEKAAVEGGLPEKAKIIPTDIPTPIKTIEIYDAAKNKRVEADVLSLKSKEIRERLTSTETLVSIEKKDASGSLSYLGAGGKVAKGSYRVTFDYANYTTQNVTFNADKSAALGMIGVGLRITADLETTENGVDLGGLLPIGFAAQNSKVSGRLGFRVYGMSNDKVALAVPSNAILDVTSIQQSFESAAAVRVLFGLEDTKLEPYLIGVAGIQPLDAKNALEAATQKLTK